MIRKITLNLLIYILMATTLGCGHERERSDLSQDSKIFHPGYIDGNWIIQWSDGKSSWHFENGTYQFTHNQSLYGNPHSTMIQEGQFKISALDPLDQNTKIIGMNVSSDGSIGFEETPLPTGAELFSLDLTLESNLRIYHELKTVEWMNEHQNCGINDWELNVARQIVGKDRNCLGHLYNMAGSMTYNIKDKTMYTKAMIYEGKIFFGFLDSRTHGHTANTRFADIDAFYRYERSSGI